MGNMAQSTALGALTVPRSCVWKWFRARSTNEVVWIVMKSNTMQDEVATIHGLEVTAYGSIQYAATMQEEDEAPIQRHANSSPPGTRVIRFRVSLSLLCDGEMVRLLKFGLVRKNVIAVVMLFATEICQQLPITRGAAQDVTYVASHETKFVRLVFWWVGGRRRGVEKIAGVEEGAVVVVWSGVGSMMVVRGRGKRPIIHDGSGDVASSCKDSSRPQEHEKINDDRLFMDILLT